MRGKACHWLGAMRGETCYGLGLVLMSEWINLDRLGTKGMEPDLMPPHRDPASLDAGTNVRALGPNIANAGGYLKVIDIPGAEGEIPAPPGYEPRVFPQCSGRGAPDDGWEDVEASLSFPSWPSSGAGGAHVGSCDDGRVILACGNTTAVLELDYTVTSHAAPPEPARYGGYCALGNKLYIFGGGNVNDRFGGTYIFDADTGQWTTGTANPNVVTYWEGAVAAESGNNIYVFGGGGDVLQNDYKAIYRYDTISGGWTAMTSVFNDIVYNGGACTLKDGRILIVHGDDFSTPNRKRYALYSPWSDNLEQGMELPATAEGGVCGFVFRLPNGNGYMAAAYASCSSGGSQHWEFDYKTNTWVRRLDSTAAFSRNTDTTTFTYLSTPEYCTVWECAPSRSYFGKPYSRT